MQKHEAHGSSQTEITTGDAGRLKALADLIRNDAFAMSFQSVRQYREALLKEVRIGAEQPEAKASLDDKIIAHLLAAGGSTAWAMRGHVGELDRPAISRALQRLKRKGLVRTSIIQPSFWRPVTQRNKGGEK